MQSDIKCLKCLTSYAIRYNYKTYIMKHLKDHGMTYFQHMRLAFTYAYKLAFMAIAAVIHAFIPCILKTYVSNKLKEMTS